MLDKFVVPTIRPALAVAARGLNNLSVSADSVTVTGFLLGLAAVPALATGHMILALCLLLLNRLADGIDGELARITATSDAGSFLDITLDFIFYSAFPIGFALLNPAVNALPAAVLIASFVGTGASFLAFAVYAEKQKIERPQFAYKGLFYLEGLAEGTETIACFALMCMIPAHFATLAWAFAALCLLTTISRVFSGYRSLR